MSLEIIKSGLYAVLGILALSVTTSVHADALVRYFPDPLPEDGKLYNNLDVYVSPDGVSMKGKTGESVEYAVWFETATGTFRIYDPRRAGFFEIRPTDGVSLRQEQDKLLAQIEERIAKAETDRERESIRNFGTQTEKRLYGGSVPQEPRYELHGESSVDGYACEEISVFEGEESDRILCTTNYETVGLEPEDWKILELMGDTALRIRQSVGRLAAYIPRFAVDLTEGVPVAIEYYRDGKIYHKLKMEEVDDREIKRDLFLEYQSLKQISVPGFS